MNIQCIKMQFFKGETQTFYSCCLLDNTQVTVWVKFTRHTSQTTPPPPKKVARKQIFSSQMIKADRLLETQGFVVTSELFVLLVLQCMCVCAQRYLVATVTKTQPDCVSA